MLIPFDWLKEYIDIDVSVQQLADALTMAGLEVADISYFQPEMDNVVVGEILKIKPHPASEKLQVCQISDGRQIFSVVCGARNINVKDRVTLARVGATLPNGIKIGKKKILEELSSGMLCSEKELGISEGHEGILILPKNAKLGEKVQNILLNNPVMDIDLTTNRFDCASVVGVAREVSALLHKPLKLPDFSLTETGGSSTDTLCQVEIADTGRCRRYIARVIQDVTVGPSPAWLVKRLNQCGMRPVNNVVDITNYVLAELGHPLHAFDYDKLSAEHKIVIRRGDQAGEKIRCLDNIERKIDGEDLVIADSEKPIAIAGIIGGADTGVVEATKNILLESAYFSPDSIRKTSKKNNISTEASCRFERGVDINNLRAAINRAAQLIQKICGGSISGGVVDIYPQPVPETKLDLYLESVNKILGSSIDYDNMTAILKSLGFGCEDREGGQFSITVTVPSYRNDISSSMDLAEEIARNYGYNNILSKMPSIQAGELKSDEIFKLETGIKSIMKRLGFFEVMNFSLVGEEALEKLDIIAVEQSEERNNLQIKNPLIAEQSLLRDTLLPGLLSTVRRNLNYKISDMKIFELGRVFHKKQEKNVLPVEKRMLGGCLTGSQQENYWGEVSKPVDFHYLKGIMETILKELNITNYRLEHSKNPVFNPGNSSDIFKGDSFIGTVGEISRTVQRKYDFIMPVYSFNIDFDRLCELADFNVKFISIPRYPLVKRDISIYCPLGLTYDKIFAKIIDSSDALVANVHLFDVYKGEQVNEGYQGMAFSITYQSANRTLIDQEVNDLHEKIVTVLERDLKVIIRK